MRLLRVPQVDVTQTGFSPDQVPSEYVEAHKFSRRGLFIGGCQKSGTTLLMSLMDDHPQLVVLPAETHYLEEWRKHLKLHSYEARLERLLDYLSPLADARFDFRQFASLARNFINQPWMNDSLFLSETIRAYGIVLGADWQNCIRWVEKTPKTETYSRLFDQLFPDARLIQVVRDPRAVFATIKNSIMSRSDSHAKAHRLPRLWNRSAREIPRLRKAPSRFLVVRYEDLVKNPRDVLETICRFGGIEFNERLLKPTRAGDAWKGNSSFYDSFNGICTAPADKWMDCLTEHEIWWIELHCRRGMELAGYPLRTDARFSFRRWFQRLPGESRLGYIRARRASLCQGFGLLKDCRYSG